MLTYLRIRNLALVEDAVLEPDDGLVAFTGETGAGKSIILGGLELIIGRRASLDQVRAGATEAVVEAIFRIDDRPELAELLEREGVAANGSELLVRRRIRASGSRAYLNDDLVTVAMLERVGGYLIDIVGQHESQRLLRPQAQLELLDASGGLAGERREVAEAWDEAVRRHGDFIRLRDDDRDRAQRADYLRFQVAEIRDADLDADEEVQLTGERQRLRHADQLSSSSADALSTLYEAENSAAAQVARAERAVENILELDPDAALPSGLQEARFHIEELGRSLQAYRDTVRSDPARLESVEQRLAQVDQLRRKYGDTIEQILERATTAEQELASIDNRDSQLAELASIARDAARRYDDVASELSAARSVAAEALERQITSELQELGMEGARFGVRLQAGQREVTEGLPPGSSRSGYESVEFELAANPGEPAGSLSRVASGGETSRVLLALKLAGLSGSQPLTLVFDEVDAGVGGGRVAECLADRLGRLGGSHQVLVVTHLPQIAGRADTQVKVSKMADQDRTTVDARALDDAGRVDELARMLGGVDATSGLREHARELLRRD
ncbi:MAG: DNA repair protein RecN [Acidobacteria bacterium]|nr:DNA repair protein RecN [Acidobacteriota bacterium]